VRREWCGVAKSRYTSGAGEVVSFDCALMAGTLRR